MELRGVDVAPGGEELSHLLETVVLSLARFPSNPSIIRVPFFLIFGFNKAIPQNKKAKRVLLGNLGLVRIFRFGAFGFGGFRM